MTNFIDAFKVPEEELAEATGTTQPVDPKMEARRELEMGISAAIASLFRKHRKIPLPCPDCASGCCRPRRK